MEVKHFSHNHGLTFEQVPQGSEMQCSACKSPASGNTYVCRQCSYFLHEQCFRAARSLKHPSHPLHPLTLAPFPTYPSGSFSCNSCNHGGDGFSYTCSECEFDIHIQCALMPKPNPHSAPSYTNSQPQSSIYPPQPQSTTPNANPSSNQHQQSTYPPPPWAPETKNLPPEPANVIKHFSHPHVLDTAEIEEKSGYVCSACECEPPSGCVYFCGEAKCSFLLDKVCFEAPREIRHKSHPQHSLTLLAASPGEPFDCHACWTSGEGMAYACLTCSTSIHIDCVNWPDTVAAGVADVHEMTLYYSAAEGSGEDVAIPCDGCDDPINQNVWRYYCRRCHLAIHTRCRFESKLYKSTQRLILSNYQLQMARQNALRAKLFSTWKKF